MGRAVDQLAIFGAAPTFSAPLHVAQLYLPAFDKVEAAFRGILKRRYFTNNGPLVREFEQRLADSLGVPHVVCMTNGTMALMAMAKAFCRTGEVIVPTFTFPATVQALSWAGLKPVLCDVDLASHMLTPEFVMPLITERTEAILGVHLWGAPCATTGLEALAAKSGVKLLFDACHGMGCVWQERALAAFGDAAVLSFHATKIVSAAEGGCVVTNDSAAASELREIRTFYSANTETTVPRMNGRMSEAQAAFGLLSLDDMPENIRTNRHRYEVFQHELEAIAGVSLLALADGNNFQYVVLDIDESVCGLSRDQMMQLLKAENVFCRRHFFPGLHRLKPYATERAFPNAERLCGRLLQLPSGEPISLDAARKICELISDMIRLAPDIRGRI